MREKKDSDIISIIKLQIRSKSWQNIASTPSGTKSRNSLRRSWISCLSRDLASWLSAALDILFLSLDSFWPLSRMCMRVSFFLILFSGQGTCNTLMGRSWWWRNATCFCNSIHSRGCQTALLCDCIIYNQLTKVCLSDWHYCLGKAYRSVVVDLDIANAIWYFLVQARICTKDLKEQIYKYLLLNFNKKINVSDG